MLPGTCAAQGECSASSVPVTVYCCWRGKFRTLSSLMTLCVTGTRQPPCRWEGALCSVAVPGWGPGPPLPGPLTLTPLKLEPSLQAMRLSWEVGTPSPSLLDSVQSEGLWGCPQSRSRPQCPCL